jgi:hypothetical protein
MISDTPAWTDALEHGEHPNDLIVEACVYNDDFTQNGQTVYYIDEPTYQEINPTAVPRNLQRPVFTRTDFKWDQGSNTPEKFKKNSNFTCRFQGREKTIVVPGKMVVYPFSGDENAKPTHVMCKSPKWHRNEPVTMDISINGQDYSGAVPFTFDEPLELDRIVPMSGPNEGTTTVKLLGSGFDQ